LGYTVVFSNICPGFIIIICRRDILIATIPPLSELEAGPKAFLFYKLYSYIYFKYNKGSYHGKIRTLLDWFILILEFGVALL
jgi:hypothetical protein